MQDQPENMNWRGLSCVLPLGWTVRDIPEQRSIAVLRKEDAANSMLETILLFVVVTEYPQQSTPDFITNLTLRRTRVQLPIEPDRIGTLDAQRVDWTDGINDIVSWFVPTEDRCFEIASSTRALPVSVGSAEALGKFVCARLQLGRRTHP